MQSRLQGSKRSSQPIKITFLRSLHRNIVLAFKIDAPCSACQAMAAELQKRIDSERVRNHLDMRHRLDSKGERYGKMIEYKVSELRAVELLENLCTLMNEWTLVTVNSTDGKTSHWERSSEAAPRARLPSLEEGVRHKQLINYCGRVLEEHDDDITGAIQAGKLENGGVSDWLCKSLIKSCPAQPASASAGKRMKKGSVIETADGTTSKQSEAAADAAAAAAAASPAPASGQEGNTQPDAAAAVVKAEL